MCIRQALNIPPEETHAHNEKNGTHMESPEVTTITVAIDSFLIMQTWIFPDWVGDASTS